jgi:hypothetical protein
LTVGSSPWPTFSLAGLRDHAIHHAIVNGFMRKQPRTGRAALALILEDRTGRGGNGKIEIGVRKHDGG